MKTCSQCGKVKPLSSYYTDKSKVDAKRPCCKSCDNERLYKTRRTTAYKIRFNPYQKEWQRSYRRTDKYKKWRKVAGIKHRDRRNEAKAKILAQYGAFCACCGENNACFLTIDHIHNDGYKERNGSKYRAYGLWYYLRIIAANYPDNLQILCFNCNIAKQHNGGECPHKQYAFVRDRNE